MEMRSWRTGVSTYLASSPTNPTANSTATSFVPYLWYEMAKSLVSGKEGPYVANNVYVHLRLATHRKWQHRLDRLSKAV